MDTAHLKLCLEEARSEFATEIAHKDLLETQKKRLFGAAKAHFDVEKKTFADVLLKKTQGILLKGHKDWIKRNMLSCDKIRDSAGEDKRVTAYRNELKAQLHRLKECESLLHDVQPPTKKARIVAPTPTKS